MMNMSLEVVRPWMTTTASSLGWRANRSMLSPSPSSVVKGWVVMSASRTPSRG
jgi:hypothetical protein